MALKVKPGQLGQAIARFVIDALSETALEQVLVGQAQQRMDEGGDSEIKYLPLWIDKVRTKGGKAPSRAGGRPLIDTRTNIYDRLSGRREVEPDSVTYVLLGPLLALLHHRGFGPTAGPNFIPLNRRAGRIHRAGMDPGLEGLVAGEDYIIVKSVTIPARPIFRFSPENVEELRFEIVLALRRAARRS